MVTRRNPDPRRARGAAKIDKAAADTVTADTATADTATANSATTDMAAVDRATTDKATADRTRTDKATTDKVTAGISTAAKVGKVGHDKRRRRIARMALLLGIAFAPLSVSLVAQKFILQTNGIVTYTPDDAAAFAWLRQHAQPGEVVMNDGAADAGIWAAYKTGVSIVLPRSKAVDPRGPESLVRANFSGLDTRPEVREAACRLGVRYVYRGASNSPKLAQELAPAPMEPLPS